MTFPYFNHGIGGLNDSLDFYVWFEDDPSRARRKLTSALNWPKGLTLVGAKDWCGHHVHAYEAYGKYNGFGAHVLGSDYAPSKAPKEFKAGWAGLDEDMRRLVGFGIGRSAARDPRPAFDRIRVSLSGTSNPHLTS